MVTSAPRPLENSPFISSVLFLKNERCSFGAARQPFTIDAASNVPSDSRQIGDNSTRRSEKRLHVNVFSDHALVTKAYQVSVIFREFSVFSRAFISSVRLNLF